MPLINRCGGGGSVPELCAQVENFKAIRASAQLQPCNLSWTAPNDDSYVGVRIVRKTGSYPKNKYDGTVIYEGTALSYSDTDLTEGTTYYYRAFAYNAKKRYQTARAVANYYAYSFKSVFANNSWDDIALACELNIVPNTWAVGDQKTMTIGDENIPIDIIGKNHNTYAAGGTAPLTFQLHDCLSRKSPWATNYDSIISIMPSNVRERIKTVLVNVSLTSDAPYKLFSLSEKEVFGVREHGSSEEGKQYEYYAAGNSKIKKANSVEVSWWLRTVIYFVETTLNGHVFVTTKGTASWNQSGSLNINFAFCF